MYQTIHIVAIQSTDLYANGPKETKYYFIYWTQMGAREELQW